MIQRLNPLQQRLFLYGFAYVQVDPFHPVDVEAWELPGLQCFLEPHCFHGWCGILRPCRPFSEGSHQPVVSPSLRGLLRLRRRFPLRRLILVQTAFEPEHPPAKLRPLARPNRRLGRLLHRDDSLHPLYWLGGWPKIKGVGVTAWSGLDHHPYEQLLKRLVRERPQSQFWVQEDGRLLEQPSLFAERRGSRPDAAFRKQLIHFECAFREQWSNFKGSAYVFARNRARLAWFQRDCLRLLGKRVCCWPFPRMPDPRDPLPHLILIRDHQIRLTRLDRTLPCFFLDGEARRHRFRHYRVGHRQAPRWISQAKTGTVASYRLEGQDLVFRLGREGWWSRIGPEEGDRRGTELFAQHLEMLGP